MKLPDFTKNDALNVLRLAMGAHLRDYVAPASTSAPLTESEIEALSKTGIEIPLEDVRILSDGTLAYKTQRVVLYIRDVRHYRNKPIGDSALPRFHIANCDKLKEMRANKRFERYVVATRDTGIFQINLMSEANKQFKRTDRRLNVCQFCLAAINWSNFVALRQVRTHRIAIVASFKLQEFYDQYGKTYIAESPKHTDESGPLNDYDANFPLIAQRIKERRGYRCGKCGADFSKHKKFLHAHHINGQKYDNREDNIELLCVAQHAKEPYHGHVKSLATYKEYSLLAVREFKECVAK